jgi:hypothetical protein
VYSTAPRVGWQIYTKLEKILRPITRCCRLDDRHQYCRQILLRCSSSWREEAMSWPLRYTGLAAPTKSLGTPVCRLGVSGSTWTCLLLVDFRATSFRRKCRIAELSQPRSIELGSLSACLRPCVSPALQIGKDRTIRSDSCEPMPCWDMGPHGETSAGSCLSSSGIAGYKFKLSLADIVVDHRTL